MDSLNSNRLATSLPNEKRTTLPETPSERRIRQAALDRITTLRNLGFRHFQMYICSHELACIHARNDDKKIVCNIKVSNGNITRDSEYTDLS